MRDVLFILVCLFYSHSLSAQCYCEDCPEPIDFGSPSTATLNISGATNNILGMGGQSLVNVGLQFTHDAAQELSLRIVAPNGSFVDLTIGEGFDVGENNVFDINFVQCGAGAFPDCTNNSAWVSTDEWGQGPYSGTYFPESGCLEDLTGDMNGTWTLEMEDVFVSDDGELFCFDLTFADGSGISCNFALCDEILCLAQGGSSISPNTVTAPEGDPSLLIDYTIDYMDCEFPPSEPEYIFVYVIFEAGTQTILEIVEGSTVDMTGYAEGNYVVRGLSILASDLPVIQALDFPTTTFFDLTLMIQAGTICADFTILTSQVNIDGCVINFLGTLELDMISAEVGNPALDPNWLITWVPAAPDFGIWGVSFVVYDQTTGVIIEYISTDDFTGLVAGEYNVSVLVYSLADVGDIPLANGSNTFTDLENATITEDVCGITFGLNTLIISEPCTIDIGGMLEMDIITAPQGDPTLDPIWDITFTGAPPDPAVYNFYFVVYDAFTDVLVALYTTDNFTPLLEGNYFVSIVYFELGDEALLPSLNGINTFTDIMDLIDNGAICGEYFGQNELIITPPCVADAGTLSPSEINACVGSSDLFLDLTPSYSGGEPDLLEYGYTYIVSQIGVIIDINESQDFTGYSMGTYEICGLSYLITDVALLPFPNGITTTTDISTDIVNQVYCADLTLDCISLTIVDAPEPIFTGTVDACLGEQVQYVVDNFNGDDSDYIYSIDQGGYSMFTNNGNGTVDVIWTAGPGEICVSQANEGCEEQVCIDVNIVPLPEFTIEGFDVVCQGEEYVYTFNPSPSGSEFYDVSIIGGVITNQTTNTVTINWDDVDDGVISVYLLGGACDSELEIFEVMEPSDPDFPVLVIPSSNCMSTDFSIEDLDDPEILVWEWSATNADVLIEAGMVNFSWISDGPAEICLEIMTFCGVEEMCYDVDVLQVPNAINLTTVCDGDSYVVEFEIEGGTAPYTINGDAVGSTTFTSMPIASGDVYNFTIVDALGCTSDLIEGVEVCNCVTDAGTMSSDEIIICAIEGTLISGTFNDDALFDSDDGGIFILHDGSSNFLGNIINFSSNSEFIYSVNYGVGVTLYLSYVVGDEVNGGILLTDDCLSVAIGQPVIIEPVLQVETGEYNNQCDLGFDLNADDQGVAGIWSVVDSPNNSNVVFGNEMDPQSSFETDIPGLYSISWQPMDAECILPDTATFELEAILAIEDVIIECAEDLETYAVTIEISGGESPYYLDGIETTNPFDLSSIASGASYNSVLIDSRGCELSIEGTTNCDCMNMGGSMSLDTLKGCVGDTLTGTYNEDAILDSNDRELFVLHTSSADSLGAVFFISDEPVVFFAPGLIVGNVYYLSHMIGNQSGPGIDFNDPCLKISFGQPVIFGTPPMVDAGADQELCGLITTMEGSSSETNTIWSVIQSPFGAIVNLDENDLNGELSVTLSGEYILALEADNGFCNAVDTVSITFIESLSYQDLDINCMADGYTVSFSINGGISPYFVDGVALVDNIYESELIASGDTYIFTITDNGDCPAIDVDGVDTCECENEAGTMTIDPQELCIDMFVDLNTLNNNDFILDTDDNRYHVIHTSPTNELGDVIGYLLFLSGTQELAFTDFAFVEGVTYYVSTVLANMGVLEGGVDDPCVKVAPGTPIVWSAYNQVSFNDDVVACLGETISIQITTNGSFPFEVVLSDGLGIEQMVVIDQENFELDYIVTGETTLNINPTTNSNCLTIENGELSIAIEELPTTEVREISIICNNDEFGSIINLDELLVSGYDGGKWLFNGNEITNSIDFDGFTEGEYEIEYLIESAFCSTSESYISIVTVEDCDCPMFDYASLNVSCFGEADGSISIFPSSGVDLADYAFFLNNSDIGNNTEIIDLAAGDYTLDITDGMNCVASFDINIAEPLPVQISLGEDMETVINDPVVIEAITNLLAQEIEGITWSSLEGILEGNDLLLNTSFEKDDMISINIVDENGCEASDDIMVRVTFSDYSIPNVINTNSTSGNEVFKIYNGDGIDEVVSLTIYDRWGNLMFGVEHVLPDSDAAQWDGRFSGQAVNPGVYIYRMVLMVRGEQVVVFGDLTVL